MFLLAEMNHVRQVYLYAKKLVRSVVKRDPLEKEEEVEQQGEKHMKYYLLASLWFPIDDDKKAMLTTPEQSKVK